MKEKIHNTCSSCKYYDTMYGVCSQNGEFYVKAPDETCVNYFDKNSIKIRHKDSGAVYTSANMNIYKAIGGLCYIDRITKITFNTNEWEKVI